MKIYGLIPARKGSKGLKGKNHFPLWGRPLIDWTIESAKRCGVFEKIYVSTNDEVIKSIVHNDAYVDLIERPDQYCSDSSSADEVVQHFLDTYSERLSSNDLIIYLQPTSPLRSSRDIANALEIYRESECSMVISVYEPRSHPAKAYILDHTGELKGFVSNDEPYKRRQDLPYMVQPNGAIYIFSVGDFKSQNGFPRQNVRPYIMDSVSSIDVDNLSDIKILEEGYVRNE